MSLTVPLFSTQTANRGLNIYTAIKRVLDSHWYILGNEVVAFEGEFADFCGVSHCVGVANGTDALELGLRACGVTAGDEVFLVANAGFYGSSAARSIDANPVYVDVDKVSLTLSVDSLRRSLTESTPKAIVVTHLYGQLAEVEAIVKLAEEKGIAVVEDCAQSHGAQRNGKRAGSFGTVGCFSFYPTKNLGALGDGGAVVTNDSDIAERLRQLRQYGWGTKYRVEVTGGRNSRLDEIQAAILRLKLPHLNGWNAQRRDIAKMYNQAFQDLPMDLPSVPGEEYIAHLYVLRMKNRKAFCNFLARHGVVTDVHYPVADHLQPAYKYGESQRLLPVTENACDTVVTLPCFPGLTESEVDYVIRVVHSYIDRGTL